MARSATGRASGVAVEIIELGPARHDPYLVLEGDGVGQRELNPAAVLAARTAEEAAAKATAAPAKPAAPSSTAAAFGRRSWGRASSASRSTLGALASLPTLAEAELLAQLVDHRLRWAPRLQRLGEVEPNP